VAPQREWFEKDYYAVLGVSKDATAKDISKAYKKLAKQYHPDANKGDKAAEERFKEISAAYEVVGDDTKRAEYDEVRRLGPMGAGFGGQGGANPFGDMGNVRFGDGEDLTDLLGGLFGSGMRRGRGRTYEPPGGGGAGPRKGNDLEATLTMSFDDAAKGITTTLQLTSDAACTTCGGNGARPGTAPRVCQNCQGRGVVADNQGFFSFSQPCTACSGNGMIIDSPCGTCRGTGVERRPREVKVRIPAGVTDGSRIRLKGRGGPGRNGGPPGDLFVSVKVQPHTLFNREGDDLVLHVPVTYPEAVLGADVRVPTLDGSPVTIRIKPGTQPGMRYRVKGKGVHTARSEGDLIAVIDVVVPAETTAAERKAVEDLGRVVARSPREHLGV
jgi:molecular chaperone DnaJ